MSPVQLESDADALVGHRFGKGVNVYDPRKIGTFFGNGSCARKTRLTAVRGNCRIDVWDVGVYAAEFAFTLSAVLAQPDDRARFHHFEEIETRGVADRRPRC